MVGCYEPMSTNARREFQSPSRGGHFCDLGRPCSSRPAVTGFSPRPEGDTSVTGRGNKSGPVFSHTDRSRRKAGLLDSQLPVSRAESTAAMRTVIVRPLQPEFTQDALKTLFTAARITRRTPAIARLGRPSIIANASARWRAPPTPAPSLVRRFLRLRNQCRRKRPRPAARPLQPRRRGPVPRRVKFFLNPPCLCVFRCCPLNF